MRQESEVIIWKDFKPTVIDDENLTIDQLSLARTQFFGSSNLISMVQQTIKHQGFDKQESFFGKNIEPAKLASKILMKSTDRDKGRVICTLPRDGRVQFLKFSDNTSIYFEQRGEEVKCSNKQKNQHSMRKRHSMAFIASDRLMIEEE